MKEIDWKEVVIRYELTPKQLETQVFTTASILADMHLDDREGTELHFTCEHKAYTTKLTVSRVGV